MGVEMGVKGTPGEPGEQQQHVGTIALLLFRDVLHYTGDFMCIKSRVIYSRQR